MAAADGRPKSRFARAWRARAALVALIAFAAAGCVDGATPDCPDTGDNHCAPDLDGSPAKTDAGTADAPPDAPPDAPLDAPLDAVGDVVDAPNG